MSHDTATPHRFRAAPAALLAIALAVGLAACQQDDGTAMTPAQADEALKLQHDYEAAVANRNFAGAAEIADKLRRKYPDSEQMKKVRLTLDDTIARAEATLDNARLAALWEYQAVAAGDGTQYTALIPSRTQMDEDGVPLAPPDARMVLRVHPEWGKSAYLLLAQSQFACGDPCTMQIAFDDAPAESFLGKQADSGNGPALFIEERERFYAAMRNAQVVKIMLPSSGGLKAPTLRFDVGGYDANRLGADFTGE
jgi:hypothetical protein